MKKSKTTGPKTMKRRDFMSLAVTAGAASLAGGQVLAREADTPFPVADDDLFPVGLLYPQQNQIRNMMDMSGIWQFQPDPQETGEKQEWFRVLPKPRQISVPCSWNDLFDDLRDYLGLVWYLRKVYFPYSWRVQRVFIRIGSANYAAKVWLNGKIVAQHMGGHLPFIADISRDILWDQENTIAITVENKQLPERVPPGAEAGKGGVAGVMAGYPLTTYDFFPYSGLHRQVILYTVPVKTFIDDITVKTSIEGQDGIVNVKVVASGQHSGNGKVQMNGKEVALNFRNGSADASIRVPSAQLWSPENPYLYKITFILTELMRIIDSYSLEIGIRTISVRQDQILLNGKPIILKGFGKHEDFPLNGRGLNLPMWIRDFELLRWVGANSFRTSHYPYAEEAMQLADRLGIMVINEIPAVGLNFEDPEEVTAKRLIQCRQQIRELIARDKNHPSTIMWNLANEPMGGLPMGMAPPNPKAVASGLKFFQTMYDETRSLDDTRPVSHVGVQGGPKEWFGISDVICINAYYGWYSQSGQLSLGIEALEKELDDLFRRYAKPVILTEFGADTIAGAHNNPAEMWTEEYQVEFIRGFLDVAVKRPFMAGMHVWAFADFKTGQGISRAAGMNFKGVFTRDRRPKMSAHLLRSRWTKA